MLFPADATQGRQHVREGRFFFVRIPRPVGIGQATMAQAMKPDHDRTVQHHRHRRGALHRQGRAIGRVLQPKQLLGLEDPANRTALAVQRTAPMAVVLYSAIVIWFHRLGHRCLAYPDRPWYPHKEEPSFADMLTTLRRISWEEHLRQLLAGSGLLRNSLSQLIDFASRA